MLKNLPLIATYPVFIRIPLFLLCLMVIWLPFAIPLYLSISDNPNLVTILTMGLLYLAFIFLLKGWNKWVYQVPQWLGYYGLTWTRKTGINYLTGLSIGYLFSLILFIVEGSLGWIYLKSSSFFLLKIIIEGWLSASLIALAEELFFRGWLLIELEKDYSLKTSLWLNAIIFATLHFLKPIDEIKRTFPQFPALVLLGIILVISKRQWGNQLGMNIGLHAGLVWGYYIINVGKLVSYPNIVHPWITGIDHNPLAGMMGLLFLGLLAIGVYYGGSSWQKR